MNYFVAKPIAAVKKYYNKFFLGAVFAYYQTIYFCNTKLPLRTPLLYVVIVLKINSQSPPHSLLCFAHPQLGCHVTSRNQGTFLRNEGTRLI